MKNNKSILDYVADITACFSIMLVIALIAIFWGIALYVAICVLFGTEF